MKPYLWHLKQQTMHQLRAPLGLPTALAEAGHALVDVCVRVLLIPMLPLAPVFACFTLWSERKTAERGADPRSPTRHQV